MMTQNTLFLDALHGRNLGRPPVWLMRQAGRYLPEYREIRQKHSFLQLCHTPELMAEVTLQPIRAFGMDAAILFSDILLIPEALKVGLQFHDSIGPLIERPLENAAGVAALPKIDLKASLAFMAEGIKLLKRELRVPLIGFAGAPFTLASYMIEGKTDRTFRKTKQWMLTDPVSFHQLLDLLAEQVIASLELQIDAGADALQIFDTWAGMLAYQQFRAFSLPYLQKILDRLAGKAPIILFCRGASAFVADLISIGPQGISFDWNINLPGIRSQVPSKIAVQGNLDPEVLHAPPAVVRAQTKALLSSMRGDQGYIFNLGHGITPETPVESVKVLIDTVHASAPQRR